MANKGGVKATTVSYRAGVRASYWVRRKLRLDAASTDHLVHDPKGLSKLELSCQQLLGFNRLALAGSVLLIEYDAGYLQLDSIVSLLEQAGIRAAPGRWNRMRQSWYRYQDGNVRDNSRNTDSSCCSQSPLRHR